MRYSFPQDDKKYSQFDRGNIFGNLWSTMGLDFQENPGVIRLSPRFQVLTKTGDANATTLGCPVGFKALGANYWTIAGAKVYNNSANGGLANSAFVEDTSTSASSDYTSDYSDIEVFNSRIWVTAPTKLRSNPGGAWTDRETFGATLVPHMLNYFVKFNRLYYIYTANSIGSIDSSDASVTSGDYTLTLDSTYSITSIRSTSTYIYIGTVNISDATGKGVVFQWDGISAQPTNQYKLKARSCVSIVILDDIPYAMDSNGILSKYSGTSFIEVARLPNKGRLTGAVRSDNQRFIHPNGMAITKNNTILAFINNLNGDGTTIDENMPSGSWEYAPQTGGTGFTHKRAVTYNPVGTSTITDFGQNRISRAGGIAIATDGSTSGIQTVMAGATYYTDATNTLSGIFIENTTDTVQKKGYFVITWIETDQAAEGWARLWASYRRFLDVNDKIVFKYRIYEEAPVDATITWVDTRNFTTTTDITAYGPTSTGFNGTSGGEVEITQGTGGALCAHITSVTNNAGTYTVTIDEAATGVITGTAKARFQKWIKLNPAIPLDQIRSWAQFGIDTESTPRIEIKGCFTYTGAGEFYKITVVGNSDIKINL